MAYSSEKEPCVPHGEFMRAGEKLHNHMEQNEMLMSSLVSFHRSKDRKFLSSHGPERRG